MQIKKSIIRTVTLSKVKMTIPTKTKKLIKGGIVLKLLLPSLALAQIPTDILDTPEKAVGILNTVAGWLFTILFALAVVMIIYAAFLYLTAAGSPDRINSAKSILIYAIVAIVIALVAGGIPTLIEGILTDSTGVPHRA